MARRRARSVEQMFSGAVKAQETETIAELKTKIEELESKEEGVQFVQVADIIPLKLPGKLKTAEALFQLGKNDALKGFY